MKFEQDIRKQLKWIIGQLKCFRKRIQPFSKPTLEYDEATGKLSSTYVDDTTKVVQLDVPRKTSELINDGENGIESFISLSEVPSVPEYTFSPITNSNKVNLLKDGISVSEIDLTPYLDNTNLARLVSGSLNGNTGIATFTRDDSSTFTVDFSDLLDNTKSSVTIPPSHTTGAVIATHNDGDGTSVDIKETITSLSANANVLTYTKEDGTTDTIDLSLYLDDSHLARLSSGTVDTSTGIATFTRDDNTTFTVDFSALLNHTKGTVNVPPSQATGKTIATHHDGHGAAVDIKETITSLVLNSNTLTYNKEDGTTDVIDLSPYLDDTNLARVVSGTLNTSTGIATFTRDDNTTFTLDLSSLNHSHEGYHESGTRAGNDLNVILGDYDGSGHGTKIMLDDTQKIINLKADKTLIRTVNPQNHVNVQENAGYLELEMSANGFTPPILTLHHASVNVGKLFTPNAVAGTATIRSKGNLYTDIGDSEYAIRTPNAAHSALMKRFSISGKADNAVVEINNASLAVRNMPDANADVNFTKEVVAKADGTFGVINRRTASSGGNREGYTESGTRAGSDLGVTIGDYDDSGHGTKIALDDSNNQVDIKALKTIIGNFDQTDHRIRMILDDSNRQIDIGAGGSPVSNETRILLDDSNQLIYIGASQQTRIRLDDNHKVINIEANGIVIKPISLNSFVDVKENAGQLELEMNTRQTPPVLTFQQHDATGGKLFTPVTTAGTTTIRSKGNLYTDIGDAEYIIRTPNTAQSALMNRFKVSGKVDRAIVEINNASLVVRSMPNADADVNFTKEVVAKADGTFGVRDKRVSREVLYFVGTITQIGTNIPTITPSSVDDANLTFNISRRGVGIYRIIANSTSINYLDYEFFAQCDIHANHQDYTIKYSTRGNEIIINSLNGNTPADDILDNKIVIHMYKK